MNILFFYESMNLGGQQTQTYNLVTRIAKAGHRVDWAYLFGEGMQDLTRGHATLHHIPIAISGRDYLFRPWKLLQIARALRAVCLAARTDVIISGSGLGSLICGWVARRLGIAHFRLVGCSLVQVEKMLYRVYRWIRIDSLIDGYFGWPAVFEELRAKGVPASKFIELDNAVDTDLFLPLDARARDAARTQLGMAPDDFVIGWIGRISPDMQVGNTLALGELLRERGLRQFKLLFVGGGPWLEGLKALSVAKGLQPLCTFTDWVPMSDVNALVNAMDVVPLLEPDPQGGSIMRETMACGRVALSVDGVSGTQRRFMPESAAVLVPPANFMDAAASACMQLAADAPMRQERGHNARLYAVEHMSFDTQVQIILRACEQSRRFAPA